MKQVNFKQKNLQRIFPGFLMIILDFLHYTMKEDIILGSLSLSLCLEWYSITKLKTQNSKLLSRFSQLNFRRKKSKVVAGI